MIKKIIVAVMLLLTFSLTACKQNLHTVFFHIDDKKIVEVKTNNYVKKLPEVFLPENIIFSNWIIKDTNELFDENKLVNKDLHVYPVFEHEFFEFMGGKEGLTITGLTTKGNKLEEIIIPDYILNQKVLRLGNKYSKKSVFKNAVASKIVFNKYLEEINPQSFKENKSLKEVEINSNIKYLGEEAFANTNLIKISLKNSSFDKILEKTFLGNPNLEEIVLPETVKQVEKYAFYFSRKINKINLNNIDIIDDNSIKQTEYIINEFKKLSPDNKFFRLGNVLLSANNKIITGEVNIEEGITQLVSDLFYKNNEITKVTLPNSLLKISKSSLSDMGKLEEVIVGNNLEVIESSAFKNSIKLSKLDLKNTKLHYVGSSAFEKTNISNLVLPETLEVIDTSSFAATNLETIDLSKTKIQNIPQRAFYNNVKLKEVKLPETTKNVDRQAFAYSYTLENINYQVIKNVANDAFLKTKFFDDSIKKLSIEKPYFVVGKTLLGVSEKYLKGDVIISGDFEIIATGVFKEKNEVTSFTIKNIKYIYDDTFSNNKNLVKIVMDDNVIDIFGNAFSNNPNLEIVILSNKLEKINRGLFLNTPKLKEIIIPNNVKLIDKYAFDNSGISNIQLSNNLEKIESVAFRNTKNLKNLELPETVEIIGSLAFQGSNIEYLKVRSKVKTLNQGAFSGMNSLKEIDLSEVKLETILDEMFSNNINLEKVIFNEKVKKIYNKAFFNTPKLNSLNLDNLEYLGDDSLKDSKIYEIFKQKLEKENKNFYLLGHVLILGNKNLLGEVIIPNGVISIYDDAFKDISNVTKYIISDSVNRIGNLSFSNNLKLQEVVFGKELKYIGKKSFSDNVELEKVVFNEKLDEISEEAFSNNLKLKKLVLSKDILIIKKDAFSGSGLVEIFVPKNFSITKSSRFSFDKVENLVIKFEGSKNINYNYLQLGKGSSILFDQKLEKQA